MKLWADEQRTGTIELLGTFPVSTWSAIFGKFLAAATVWLIALLLTFPIVITVNYLGNPDNGAIFSGYLGSFLVCCTFLAITMLVSACTRDQVVCLIVSVSICVLIVLCGYDPFTRELCANRLAGRLLGRDHLASASGIISARSTSGLFRLKDFIWFGSIIFVCLLGTSAILSAKRA